MWRKAQPLTVKEFCMLAEGVSNIERAIISTGSRECILTGAYVDDEGHLVLQGDPYEDEIFIFEVVEISRDADPNAEVLIEGMFGKLHEAESFEVDEEWGRAYVF